MLVGCWRMKIINNNRNGIKNRMIIIMMKELHIMIRKNYTHRQRQRRTTSLCRRRRRFSVDLLHKYNYDNKKGRLIIDFFRIFFVLYCCCYCVSYYIDSRRRSRKRKREEFFFHFVFFNEEEKWCVCIYIAVWSIYWSSILLPQNHILSHHVTSENKSVMLLDKFIKSYISS